MGSEPPAASPSEPQRQPGAEYLRVAPGDCSQLISGTEAGKAPPASAVPGPGTSSSGSFEGERQRAWGLLRALLQHQQQQQQQ